MMNVLKKFSIVVGILIFFSLVKATTVNAYPISCEPIFHSEIGRCSSSPDNGGSCNLRCWHDVNLNHDYYSCDPSCPAGTVSTGHGTTAPPGYSNMFTVTCSFCGNFVNCWRPIPATPTPHPTNTPTPAPSNTPVPSPTPILGTMCDTVHHTCTGMQRPCQPNEANCYNSGQACAVACNAPTPTTPPATPTTPQQCIQCPDYSELCEGNGTKICHLVTHVPGQCNPPIAQFNLDNSCNGSCGPCVHPSAQPTPTPPPPAGGCEEGRQCLICDGQNGHPPPENCPVCGGSWCDNGSCHCAGPRPRPTTPPPTPGQPTNTPAPTNTPIPSPTPLAPTMEVTMAPTPTTNPQIAPTGPAGNTLSQRWVCIESDRCSDPGVNCTAGRDPVHTVQLSARGQIVPDTSPTPQPKPLANSDTYIYECLQTATGRKCTTGDERTDQKSLGISYLSDISKLVNQGGYGYTFNGMFTPSGSIATNPTQSDANGNIGPFEWESATTNQVNKTFFAMNWYDPNSAEAGSDSGQKIGLLGFETTGKKCIVIQWDPKGKVLDSSTLRPVAGAKVTLLKKVGRDAFVPVTTDDVLGSFENPTYTNNNGEFNFYVPDGTYKIQIEKDHYIFPANLQDANRQYAKNSNIYNGGEVTEKGSPTEYTIFLDPDMKSILFDTIASFFKKLL